MNDPNHHLTTMSDTTVLDCASFELGTRPTAAPAPPKTPISLLQELCTKKGLTPQYELLSAEGQVHEPTFLFRVTVTAVQATGGGKSKKVAKHMAARAVLERLIRMNPTDWCLVDMSPDESISYIKNLMPELSSAPLVSHHASNDATVSDEGAAAAATGGGGKDNANPVGILQEMSSQKKWPPPMYELISENGPPHERTFVICVRLGKFRECGEGRSKKTAKRIAAERMLAWLEKIPSEAQSNALVETVGDAEDRDIHEDLNVDKNVAGDVEIQADTATSELSVLKSLQDLDIESQTAQVTHVNMLRRIATDENWERVHFQLMPQMSKSGQYQCLVKVGSVPVAVCYGSGFSADAAKQAAAKNALEYLKAMAQAY